MNDLLDAPPPSFHPRLYRKLRLIKWLALAGGIILIGGGGYEYYRKTRIKNEGVRVEARIANHEVTASTKGRSIYHLVVDYRAPDGNETYRKEFIVPQRTYDDAVARQTVPVTFLVGEPAESLLGDASALDGEPFAIGAGLILFFLAVEMYYRRKLRQIEGYIRGEGERFSA